MVESASGRWRIIFADTYIIEGYAGTGVQGFSGDGGPALLAAFAAPTGIAVDAADNAFLADQLNHRIRRIDDLSGIVDTIAGDGSPQSFGDGGPASEAGFERPGILAMNEEGDLFVAGRAVGGGHSIRVVYGIGVPSADNIDVGINIKPHSDLNPVNLRSRGVIPVAILGSEFFNVADVDGTTLAFGPASAVVSHRNGPHFESDPTNEPIDVNDDGISDLVAHFSTQETGITLEDVEACLTGKLLDGITFEGCDAIVPFANDVRGMDFSDPVDLASLTFASTTIYSETTVFPGGFDPVAAGMTFVADDTTNLPEPVMPLALITGILCLALLSRVRPTRR